VQKNPAFAEATRWRNPHVRLKKVHDLCKGVSVCQDDDDDEDKMEVNTSARGCGSAQMRYMRKQLKISKRPRTGKKAATDEVEYITPEEAFHIFKLISDEDMKALGFHPIHSRPDWMIMTIMPVSPPAVRPAIEMDGAVGPAKVDYSRKKAFPIKQKIAFLGRSHEHSRRHPQKQRKPRSRRPRGCCPAHPERNV